MPLRFLFIFLLLTLACALVEGRESSDDSSSTKPEAGVPRELARRRSAHYRDVRYALDITLTPGAEMLKGRLKINVTLDAKAGDLVLDWRVAKKEVKPEERVSDLKVNGNTVSDARFLNDHIIIPQAHLKTGENVIEMSFASPIATSGSAVMRYLDREDKSEYIYTLFVPSDASTAFPCFDQPDLKARFTLRASAPEAWKVITNTNVVAAAEDEKGWISSSFAETKPISTYIFAFAAGPFAELKDKDSPYGTRMFVRRSKAERARKEINEVFRLNRGALKFFEGYFDHKFPFPKYDLVILPEFAYNGMEHAGATFLREESILFPSDPTSADLAARADVMFHEAAHQWFGDLVTMRWFDDLWLKEGFATFMSYKAMEALMPEFDAWKVFHLRNKPLAYLTDVTKGTTPIWQEIANLSAAKSAYGNIVYRKAPSILRQAEFYLGPPEFQRAVRLVVKEHAYANAEWADLVRAFERASGKKLDVWADAWVKRRGMPDVRVKWSADKRGRVNSFVVNQRDALGEGGVWPMRVRMLLASTDNAPPETLTVLLSGEASSVKEALGKREPAFVFANFEDYGYGRFLLDDTSRANVMRHLGSVKDDFLRALLWDTLWESVREAELAPADFIELAVAHAAREERDDVALQFVLARAQVAFLRYLSDAQRRELAPRLEGMIYERMLKAGSAGARITYYRAYREIATTPDALDKLKRMLAGTLQAPGITLRSRDRFDIVRALLSQRGAGTDEEVEALFKATVGRDTTDDGRRYAYAAEAARPLASVKQKYFAQYLNDKDVPESWIEASFGPLNTGAHAALTLPLLEPALRELPNLKRARKIFFVNGWLAAFIGGQCSAEAAGIVRDFLAREETFDRDLRLKVLEAADGLERCVRVRAKYAGEAGDKPRPSP
jgi:aminopeptidase N